MRRLLRAHRARRAGGGDRAIVRLGQPPHLGGVHVARDHQDRVVGGVIALVERQRRVARQRLDLRAPADHRHAVRVVEVERRRHLLGKQRAGVVVGALAALLQDHLALGLDRVLRQHQVAHPVGLHRHHRLEPVGGDALEIGGVVARGEGVVLPAVLGDDLGERAFGDGLGALEHQVLEEMRDAGGALRLIRRADPIPHHMRHHRGAVILDHHRLHAVAEREGGHLRPGRLRKRRARRSDQRKRQRGCAPARRCQQAHAKPHRLRRPAPRWL